MGHKELIFAISSFFMGIAGALYAHFIGSLSAYGTPGNPFSFMASIYVLIYVVFGGEKKFIGPIIGAIILTFVPEVARGAKEYMPLIFGAILIFIVFVMPEGITGLGAPLSRWYRRATRRLTGRFGRD